IDQNRFALVGCIRQARVADAVLPVHFQTRARGFHTFGVERRPLRPALLKPRLELSNIAGVAEVDPVDVEDAASIGIERWLEAARSVAVQPPSRRLLAGAKSDRRQ